MRKICIALIMAVLLISGSMTAYAQSGAVITLNDQQSINSGTESVDAVVVDWGASDTDTQAAYMADETEDGGQLPPSSASAEIAQSAYVSILYPQNVETVTENGVVFIKKTFEVSSDTNPETLVQPFEQDGFLFSKRDILRRDMPGETLTRLTFKTAETDTDSDDSTLISRQFPGVIEHEEDGYAGQLQLDTTSLVTTAASHESYSYAYTKKREISGLARNDPSYLDKEWNGMVLANVTFKQDADGLYTATAVYKGTATGKRATGYVTTAKYYGMLTKKISGNVLYTVVYTGAPIPAEPEPEAAVPDEPEAPVVSTVKSERLNLEVIAVIIIFLIGAVFIPLYLTKQQRKERKENLEAFEEIKRFIRGED